MSDPEVVVNSRVNVSMVSLKWGDVLSAILPGAVAVFAIAPFFPKLWLLIENIDKLEWTTGVALLFAAAIAGGILDGITRIGWEKWLVSKKKPTPVLKFVTPERLDIYELVVQGSYKYVTFYANLATAFALVLVTYSVKAPQFQGWIVLLLLAVIGILLRASYVQWCLFCGHLDGLLNKGKNHAVESTAGGNDRSIRSGSPHSEGAANGEATQGSGEISGGPSGRSL